MTETTDQTPNKKLEFFSRLCSDLDFRENVFSKEDSQLILQKLELRDFPIRYLLSCPSFDLQKSLLPFEYIYAKVGGRRDKRSLKVSVEQQKIFLTNLLEIKESSNSLFIFTGITDFQKARFITFLLSFIRMKTKIHSITESNYNLVKPLWYSVKGGFDDSFRDSEDIRSQKGLLDLLVLDGISLSSSKLKAEKINDLLNMFQSSRLHTDVIILAAGFDPLKIAAEHLNTTFQAGLYFDEGLITSI